MIEAFITTQGLLSNGLIYDNGAIFFSWSFSEHGPKDKKKAETMASSGVAPKPCMIWESIYQRHFLFSSRHHSRAAVGYMIPLHRRSHRGQRHVCKLPFLDLISGRKISVFFLTPSLPHRTFRFIMP